MLQEGMSQCTCKQALPPSDIGEIAVPDYKARTVKVYRFDMLCPVHRVISSVNGVPLKPREVVKKDVDKPLTAREKRLKAHKERQKRQQ